MKDILIMAIDLGTSFIKAGAYELDSTCIASASEAVRDYRPDPGVFIQKGEELFESVLVCIKKVVAELGEKSKNIEAISFTGQMSGFMGVDKDWNDITTWSCSLDSRYMPYARKQMQILKDDFLAIGGTNFPQMAPKYEWFKTEYPEENKKIVKYLMISGYVIGKLGDIPIDQATIDRTFTEWTGLADVQNDRWSDKICDVISLDQKYLPRIVNSNTIVAHLNKEMASELGLKNGIPLVSGAGDKPAGCLGAAIVHPGDAIFEAASYGEISVCTTEWRPDMEERQYDVIPSAIPGEFFASKFVAGSGITLDWYMDTFVKQKGGKTKEVFALIEEEMENIPIGCKGLMAVGLLGGSSMPLDESLRGMWMGFDWSHGKAHFYKALLESLTYDFSICLNRIEKFYPEYDIQDVRMIGGGAKSSVWPQMCADVNRKNYSIMDRSDVAMWGAVILAGNAIGVYSDLKQTAIDHINIERTYYPDLEKSKIYDKHRRLYKAFTVELHDFYRRIQELQDI